MKHRVLILTNDNVFFLLLKEFVRSVEKTIECVKLTKHESLDIPENAFPDLIIVDAKMTTVSPIELIYNLHYKMGVKSAIWLFAETQAQEYLNKALNVGANQIIAKPFNPIEISNQIVSFVMRDKIV